jgi:hypothetical protein
MMGGTRKSERKRPTRGVDLKYKAGMPHNVPALY